MSNVKYAVEQELSKEYEGLSREQLLKLEDLNEKEIKYHSKDEYFSLGTKKFVTYEEALMFSYFSTIKTVDTIDITQYKSENQNNTEIWIYVCDKLLNMYNYIGLCTTHIDKRMCWNLNSLNSKQDGLESKEFKTDNLESFKKATEKFFNTKINWNKLKEKGTLIIDLDSPIKYNWYRKAYSSPEDDMYKLFCDNENGYIDNTYYDYGASLKSILETRIDENNYPCFVR
jgi:hypothetical protein